jgi:hypothetical protein
MHYKYFKEPSVVPRTSGTPLSTRNNTILFLHL